MFFFLNKNPADHVKEKNIATDKVEKDYTVVHKPSRYRKWGGEIELCTVIDWTGPWASLYG